MVNLVEKFYEIFSYTVLITIMGGTIYLLWRFLKHIEREDHRNEQL